MMERTPAGRNPGLIWSNSKTSGSRKGFSQWYQHTHVPDVLKTGAVREAYRYETLDQNEDSFHLALYYAEDTDGLFDKVKAVPQDKKIFEEAFFDTRFYKLTQLYENRSPGADPPTICLSTEMSPGDVEEYDRWYREEHLKDGSKVKGWRRTERYELIQALRTPEAPKFLTLFFLDGDSVPLEDMQKVGSSEWTQKIVKDLKQFRSVAFKLASHHGKSLL